MKRLFSGIQPTGYIHIGNYIGAVKQWVELQTEYDCMYSIVDLHAITVPYDPKQLPERILETAIDIVASGVDAEKSILFVQSHVASHAELAWILNTITPVGELERMTQFKEKTHQHHQVLAGLMNYPILMAADILLYKTEAVPVGEDQVQHLEFSRDLARRFNQKFSQIFPEPKPLVGKGARILGLDGEGKMSKSKSPDTYIALADSEDVIRRKISRAVTDKGTESEISPAVENLFVLLETFGEKSEALRFRKERTEGKIKYSEFKPALAEAIIKHLALIHEKRKDFENNPEKMKEILQKGAERARPIAQATLKEVKQKMGLL